jgi:dipeptidase D
MDIIKIFKELTAIARCSGIHEPFIKYIKDISSKLNYICEVDEAKNILCYKDDAKPLICFQSHYDIVCLEDGKIPQIIEQDQFLMAKDSTLGADNGIGCAYMIALMMESVDGEFLFTCDEEIGLIGANNISHKLRSKYMLNLDSEEENEICIGCAGGVDIFGITKKSEYLKNEDQKDLYEITINNLQGGHSGVEIHKNIPNALKLMAKTIKECDGELLDLNGGERINSIPKKAKAIIISKEKPIPTHPNMIITKLESKTEHYKKLDSNIIDFIYTFANGVRSYNSELDVVQNSINLAIVKNEIDSFKISLSARSMDNEELANLKKETIKLMEHFGFEVSSAGKYPSWKPQKNDFVNKVFEIYKEFSSDVELKAVHAGLECAIFKEKYPQIEICSIGPNIFSPHSNQEKCEIKSVKKLYEIIKAIIKNISD